MGNILSLFERVGLEGWDISKKIDRQFIDSIEDGVGGNTRTQPTSIPSPFARIDLVKSSFKKLNEGKGDPNSKKLVSRVFDLGELLFNYESAKNGLEIIKWSIRDDRGFVGPKKLIEKGRKGHRRLGKVLTMFLEQDEKTYNFDGFRHINIFKYGGRVIGGTSPTTLLFTAPDDYYLESLNLKFGANKLFDPQQYYVPLHERDIEYQKLWYYLLETSPAFSEKFTEVTEYVEKSKEYIRYSKKELYDKIYNDKGEFISLDAFEKSIGPLDTGKHNDIVDILGVPIFRKATDQNISSQFAITADKYKKIHPDKKIPLALQSHFSKPLKYTGTSFWNPDTEVPEYHPASWKQNERSLPGLNIKYPWVTTNDFLEPYLIQLDFAVNRTGFILGSEKKMGNTEVAYLPALKSDFFDFFDIEDLENGRVQYEIEDIGHFEIKVTLKVPVNGNADFIVFEKEYTPIPSGASGYALEEPDLSLNQGFIIKAPFNVAIFPPIKSGAATIEPDYRIQLALVKDSLLTDIDLSFVSAKANRHIATDRPRIRSKQLDLVTKYYEVKEDFDYIDITFFKEEKSYSSKLIPKFLKYNGGDTKSYHVAIDFGTTNSHIEISVDNRPPEALQIDSNLILSLARLSKDINQIDIYLAHLYEFMPDSIGTKYKFPIRTALSENVLLSSSDGNNSLFSDFNIPFYFERDNKRRQDRIHEDLKWAGNSRESLSHTNAFLEQMLLLVRAKILQAGGTLQNTQISWTYPSSMTNGQVSNLIDTWEFLLPKCLNIEPRSTVNLFQIKESLAPYYHYKGNPALQSQINPVVAMDIGGGTTDMVVFYRDRPQFITSIRFAGNAVFGNGFATDAADSNGFVQRHKDHFTQILNEPTNKIEELPLYNEGVLEEKKSERILSFWFSLERHEKVKDFKNPLLFSLASRLSKDKDMKIIFLFFTSAILYHLAKIMKLKGLKLPSGFVFSGTGSKITQLLTRDNQQLVELAKRIFEGVYEEKYDNSRVKVNVFSDRNSPKEATCKGALKMDHTARAERPEEVIYTASDDRAFESIPYAKLEEDEWVRLVVEEVEAFIDFFFEINKEFSFNKEFAISPMSIKIAQRELKFGLEAYLIQAIDAKRANITDQDETVEDSLFFYPITGALQRLAYMLYENADPI